MCFHFDHCLEVLGTNVIVPLKHYVMLLIPGSKKLDFAYVLGNETVAI